MKAIYFTLPIVTLFFLGGCTTPKEKQLLPDNGETTSQLIEGGISKNPANGAYYGGEKAPFYGGVIMSDYSPNSSYTNSHIEELRRDFKRVPNPEIVMYVYPHINNNRMPVPGYFTTFRLYDRDHYALSSEGYNE